MNSMPSRYHKLTHPNTFLRWFLRATAGQVAILFAPLFIPGLYGSAGFHSVLYDVRLYFEYASRATSGSIPYRDYVVEYPPLALLVVLPPRLLTGEFGLYIVFFATVMLLFDLLALYLVMRWVVTQENPSLAPARLAWYTLFTAALYPMLASKYDWAPTAITFIGVLWWFSGRSTLGAIATTAGMFLKIYPAFIAVPAFVYEAIHVRTTRLRGTMIFFSVSVAAAGAWWALGGAASLQYHLERGLQIETLPAGILMAIGKVKGARLEWSYNHTSVELIAPGAHALAALALPMQVSALLLVVWRFWRSGFEDPLRHAGAAVLAFIVAAKVLSPQYLIWLIPFVAVLRGRTGAKSRFIFLLSCLATTLVYPWRIHHLLAFEPGTVILLNFRNGLLLALFGLLLYGRATSDEKNTAPR